MLRRSDAWSTVLLLAVLGMATPAVAAEPLERSVTVSAMAQVEAVPDQVQLTVGINTEDPKSLLTAKAENDRRTKAMLALAEKYRLSDKQVKIASLTMRPIYADRRWDDSRPVIGFRVHREIEITLQDFKVLEPLIADALKAGATNLDDVVFQTTKHPQHQVEARSRAVAYAREKAGHLAELNGLRLGKAIQIHEDVEGDRHTTGFGGAAGMAAPTSSIPSPPSASHAKVLLVQRGQAAKTDEPAAERHASTDVIPPGVLIIQATVEITFELLDRI